MSKDRARLRAEREEQAAAERAKRVQESERRAVKAGRRRRAVESTAHGNKRGRDVGIVEARRRRRFRIAVIVFVLVQVVVWLLDDAWSTRVTVLLLSLLFTPAVLAVLSNRRT